MAAERPPSNCGGSIVPDTLYTASKLRKELCWGSRSFARARRAGLRVLRYGRVCYVRGQDAIRFLDQHGDDGAAEVSST